jgi:hypothetical protein
MAGVPAARRPHFGPTERLAILQLRAARCWSLEQTAKVFQVAAATIASWSKRLDEGSDALLRMPEPVNKYPEFVRGIVQRLQLLCPRLGKVKIAQILARAGLHLAATSVGRIRQEPPIRVPTPPEPPDETMPSGRRVTADRPNHVWHTDLTVVPTAAGSGRLGCPSRCRNAGPSAGGSQSSSIIIHVAHWDSPSSNSNLHQIGSASSLAGLSPKSALRPNTLSPTPAFSSPALNSSPGAVGTASCIEKAPSVRPAASLSVNALFAPSKTAALERCPWCRSYSDPSGASFRSSATGIIRIAPTCP